MSHESHQGENKWTGLRAKIGGWMLASPIRATADRALGNSRASLLEDLDLRGAETVIDLGCGSGYLAISLARAVGPEGRVIAIDGSAAMLDHLRASAKEEGLDGVVDLHECDITEPISLDEGVADVAVASNLLHELESPERVVMEIRRLLKPGGLLLLSDFRVIPVLSRWVRHAHHEGAHGPFSPESMGALFESGGFEVVDLVAHGPALRGRGRR